MSFLEVEALSLSFDEKQVLRDVSLNVEKGELVTLLGPSGCGKSTLLRTIAGLEEPSKGIIRLDGQEIQEVPSRHRQIGMVFQSYALFPTMTVYDNIAFGLQVAKLSKEEIQKKVNWVLDLVELTTFRNKYIGTLSGGQQQRVALARSLVVEPKLLLLDEPLSALDARIRKQLQLEIRRIQKELGITMIFVTHDQEEAMRISDRIHVLSQGELAQVSTPDELYRQPKSKFVAEFIGDYNQLEALFLSGYGLVNSKANYYVRPEVIRFSPLDNDIVLPVRFEQMHVLGNVVRYQFRTSRSKLIKVDCLNDGKTVAGQEIEVLYIAPTDVIEIPSQNQCLR